MNMTDPIADMLTRVRNASLAHHGEVVLPGSRVKTEIARILVEEGFIASFESRVDDGHLGVDVPFQRAERAGHAQVLTVEGDLDTVGDGNGQAPDSRHAAPYQT